MCEIMQLGAHVLREPVDPITDFTAPTVKQTVADLLQTLADSQGLGIAAPQIGVSLAIIVVASRPTARYPTAPLMPPTVMFNPTFEHLSYEKRKDWEGCLSIPGIRALVPRYRKIQVRYDNLAGGREEVIFEDFIARIFQHECDHLEGLVYLDHVDNNCEIIAESEFFKLMAIK